MSIPQQVAPSAFDFKPPKVNVKKKNTDKEKEKWVDKRPFFGGFGAETKNQKTTFYNEKDKKVAMKAGGFQPPSSKQAKRK